MDWLSLRDSLLDGETVQCRPKGNSMTPLIESGEMVVIRPVTDPVLKGDIVFCKVRGHFYIHLVTAVKDSRYQISNNHGHINGWTGRDSIYGKVER